MEAGLSCNNNPERKDLPGIGNSKRNMESSALSKNYDKASAGQEENQKRRREDSEEDDSDGAAGLETDDLAIEGPESSEGEDDEEDADDGKDNVDIPQLKNSRRKTSPVHRYFTAQSDDPDGYRYCRVCQLLQERTPSIIVHRFSSTTGNSSLSKHLENYHKKAFAQLQKIRDMRGKDAVKQDRNQSTLDGYLTGRNSVQSIPYSPEHLALLCMRWIVACNLPFSTVELPEFRELLMLLRPQMPESEIPTRQKIAALAKEHSQQERGNRHE